MCLILFAFDAHPEYDLVIAANRDEFYERPTLPAHVWDSPAWMIAGKDLQGGGTWLGADPFGRIGMLTNFRDPSRIIENAPSRGDLIRNYFHKEQGAEDYLGNVSRTAASYNGFNLICADRDGIHYVSNYSEGVIRVDRGVHGLSNAFLDDPWPKVERGKERIANLMDRSFEVEELLDMLYDSEYAPENALPDTGVGREWEKELSPMFIKTDTYGSRTSTVILRDRKGKVTFVERAYDVLTYTYRERQFSFRIKHL